MTQEALLTAGAEIRPGVRYGFFTDTSLCIGCKACEVACKQWNSLPADGLDFAATSYDNTRALSATTWRHVRFVEQRKGPITPGGPDGVRWLLMSDVCKHCERAGCLEACPTGAIVRTEFDTVFVQQDVCNGCGYCVPSCPFGVIEVDFAGDGKAHKCTLCYDRLKSGLEPACSKACPTDSIQFGPVQVLRERAERRVAALRAQGFAEAYLYGTPGEPGATGGIGGLNAFFLLLDRPNAYNLPEAPQLPARQIAPGLLAGLATAAGLLAAAAAVFLGGRRS
ncbi:MAG: 4Fe-4S dicluster domain-containing protein [Chloroflexi bacterium]|nr:4Fe-4S dicluster domain-containing protein [Chloroflexota bacterium]